MNAMMKRLYPKKDLPERPDGCPFCLNEKVWGPAGSSRVLALVAR